MGPSDAHFGPPQPRAVEGQRPPRLRGPPVLRRVLSLRAVPTTPASHPEPGGCPGPGYSGLPRVRVGSALATALSGPAQGSLAFGPQICWPSFRGLLSGRLDVLQLPEDRPPVATRLNRQLPRQDSHLQERATFARRTLTCHDHLLRCGKARVRASNLAQSTTAGWANDGRDPPHT